MSKRHAEELSRVYASIFRDVAYAYPTLGLELERDLRTIQRALCKRGLYAVCADLVALGKHLDRCLDSGLYLPSALPLGGRCRRGVPIPKLLRGLYLEVFESSGVLKDACDLQALFFLRQILYAAKKASVDCKEEEKCEAIRSLFQRDDELPLPEKFWREVHPGTESYQQATPGFERSTWYTNKLGKVEGPLVREELSRFLSNLDIVSGLLTTTLGPYSYGEWKFSHGPGAISEVTGPTNKFRWRNWSERLESEFPYADCGHHDYMAWVDNVRSGEISSDEPYSRLICVRKTFTKPRLIAAEPSEHQWCQQNVWHYFRVRVRNSWIGEFVRFDDQTLNQRLAIRGSRDGTIATLDLSNASDCVTCHAVAQLFRKAPDLLRALQASRTRFLRCDTQGIEWQAELRKFSTMGSACTFPVESLMFLSITLAAIMTKRHWRPCLRNILRLRGDVAIFGDDICCPEDSRELLVQALGVLDFEVNTAKSYWNGKFRESCGVDAYDGELITPAFWRVLYDGGPDALASTVEVANNFYKRLLVHTAEYLDSTYLGDYPVPLVPCASGVMGRKSLLAPRVVPGGPNTRWNARLQRWELRAPVLKSISVRDPIHDNTALLQFFTEEPRPTEKWCGGVAQRPRLKVRKGWIDLGEVASSP